MSKICERFACSNLISNEWYDKYNICPECLIEKCIEEIKK